MPGRGSRQRLALEVQDQFQVAPHGKLTLRGGSARLALMRYSGKVEYSEARKMRERNTRLYRLAHWPIWIWVFFLAPGPLTFSLFARGLGRNNLIWLAVVLAATGAAGLRGRLPGVEPRPYILRFDEDKPNPLYRRVCYTFAWNAVLSFALLNLSGLSIAAVTGAWYMKQIYSYAYLPVCVTILLLGALGRLPRAALFLRFGVGRDRGAGGAAGVLEAAAAVTRGERGEAVRFCTRARGDGGVGLSWQAAADATHFARGADGRGLRSGWTC